MEWTSRDRARAGIEAAGISFAVTTHGPVRSLREAAAARGLSPERVLKSIVVRRSAGDYLFVLVPGGRAISWPKLRALLGVARLSMPDADIARDITGYERGTITPFGALQPLPVVADSSLPQGPVSIGGGGVGTAFTVDSGDLLRVLRAQVADVTDPE